MEEHSCSSNCCVPCLPLASVESLVGTSQPCLKRNGTTPHALHSSIHTYIPIPSSYLNIQSFRCVLASFSEVFHLRFDLEHTHHPDSALLESAFRKGEVKRGNLPSFQACARTETTRNGNHVLPIGPEHINQFSPPFLPLLLFFSFFFFLFSSACEKCLFAMIPSPPEHCSVSPALHLFKRQSQLTSQRATVFSVL
jgi:hypothetical protein